jgi:fumarate reductase subunit D
MTLPTGNRLTDTTLSRIAGLPEGGRNGAHRVGYSRLNDIFTNPLARLVLFGLALVTFFHWAHRFRHILIDIGLAAFGLPIAVVCYLTALAASAWAGVVAFT